MTNRKPIWLPDGKRLHLNHGPIDLIVEAFVLVVGGSNGPSAQAVARFQTMLDELVGELTELRRPASVDCATHVSWVRRRGAWRPLFSPTPQTLSPQWPPSPVRWPMKSW